MTSPNDKVKPRKLSARSLGTLALLLLFSAAAFAVFRSRYSSQRPFVEAGLGEEDFFPYAKPEEVGINPQAVRSLLREAQATHTHALIVIKDGRVVTEQYFGHPRQLLRINSVTKSVVSLAIGKLISDGKIPGVKTPLSRWFPEWKEGEKAKITLWNILTHTSGLQHEQSASQLYQQQNVVTYSLSLPVTSSPGQEFSYSNEAVALLPGIVLAASGKPLDVYLKDKLFVPMGIKEVRWDRDPTGNAMAYGGVWMYPRDLARIGQLMLNSGRWNGKQLISASWIQAATSPARADLPNYGLFWWLYGNKQAAPSWLASDSRPSGSSAAAVGYGGDGWLGQYLVVYPAWRLVAVRMHAVEAGNDERENSRYGFFAFRQRVLALVQP